MAGFPSARRRLSSQSHQFYGYGRGGRRLGQTQRRAHHRRLQGHIEEWGSGNRRRMAGWLQTPDGGLPMAFQKKRVQGVLDRLLRLLQRENRSAGL